MRILYLLPSLGHNGASRQLEWLTQGLAEKRLLRVCELGPAGGTSKRLVQAGVDVDSLGWTRVFDPAGPWRLRQLLNDWQPDLIHAWHRQTLRLLSLVGPGYLSRVILSQPFSWQEGGRLPRLDRWLMRRIARVVVHGETEARLGHEQGLFLDKIAIIPPGIAGAMGATKKLPEDERFHIVCIGPLEGHKGYRDALWAFDMLSYMFPRITLTFVGDGPERPRLEHFAHCVERTCQVQFAGATEEVRTYLDQADVCWIPSRLGGGTNAALEAMLAGKPIVAARVPNLDGLLVDGVSGFLIPPANQFACAQRTRQILLDSTLAAYLGDQARQRALQQFPAQRLLARSQRMYAEVAA